MNSNRLFDWAQVVCGFRLLPQIRRLLLIGPSRVLWVSLWQTRACRRVELQHPHSNSSGWTSHVSLTVFGLNGLRRPNDSDAEWLKKLIPLGKSIQKSKSGFSHLASVRYRLCPSPGMGRSDYGTCERDATSFRDGGAKALTPTNSWKTSLPKLSLTGELFFFLGDTNTINREVHWITKHCAKSTLFFRPKQLQGTLFVLVTEFKNFLFVFGK